MRLPPLAAISGSARCAMRMKEWQEMSMASAKQIGRGSCREKGEISVGAGSFKKKKKEKSIARILKKTKIKIKACAIVRTASIQYTKELRTMQQHDRRKNVSKTTNLQVQRVKRCV